MKSSPTLDTALQALIVDQFKTDDAAVWASTANDLQLLFARWEKRLPAGMWTTLQEGLAVAHRSGNCELLVEAASVAQVELRRRAHADLVEKQRRKTWPPKGSG